MRKIIILGASGSIGTQTLDVMMHHKEEFELVGFSVGKRIDIIPSILSENKKVKAICVQNENDASMLKIEYPQLKIFYGDDGLLNLISSVSANMIVNALVGFVGFLPTIHALKNNIDVALANKETLVVGGELIKSVLKNSKAKIYPIDSEHVALDKCLHKEKKVRRLILTASGGSFRDLSRDELKNVTKEQALKHPSWKMGNKITIDSATMMNKGFEIIEAHYLFDFKEENIDVLLHDESRIHSLIELDDNSFLADLGPSDMRIPISYALYKRKRHDGVFEKLDLSELGTLHFRKFDIERYPCVQYARYALKVKGTLPCALNAANEVAVQAFLNDEISFLDIESVIKKILYSHRVIDNPTIEDICYVNEMVRKETKTIIKEIRK